jgi:hypothetical protein
MILSKIIKCVVILFWYQILCSFLLIIFLTTIIVRFHKINVQ